jgi:hypothetical protein
MEPVVCASGATGHLVLGKAVMLEDVEKSSLSLLPTEHWKRFFIPYEQAVSVCTSLYYFLCTFLFTHV